MNLIFNFLSIFFVSAKRLVNNLGMTACIGLGLAAAVAIAMGVPIYSESINYRLLRQELEGKGRPAFAFMFWHLGSWYGGVELEDYWPINSYLTGQGQRAIGLPLQESARHIATENMRVFPARAPFDDKGRPLGWMGIGFVTDFEKHIRVIEGRLPQPVESSDGMIEALITPRKAEEWGLQAGEDYLLLTEGEKRGDEVAPPAQLPVHIAGIWLPIDEGEPFWFYSPDDFQQVFLVPEETYIKRVASAIEKPVYLSIWYYVFDGSRVRADDVPAFLDRVTSVRSRAAAILPNTDLTFSPVEAMQKYRRAAFNLTILLYVFGIPVMGLIFYFIGLISGMVVERQRNEIALLRSRGTSRAQVTGIYVLEGLLMGAFALAAGPLLGVVLAQLMARAYSFMAFADRPPLAVSISKVSVYFALIAIGLAIITSLIPALVASRHTIVTYKLERSRSARKPFWQRYFLDLFILALPLYGYYVLRSRGTIAPLGRGTVVGDPFQNPLLFLAPTLFVLALALIFIRIFPLLMSFLSWLSGKGKGASLVLALRHLARSADYYTGPMLLLTLTLGLASFTASMARTLDSHLHDQIYYEVGSDIRLSEMGEYLGPSPFDPGPPQRRPQEGSDEEDGGEELPKWRFLPAFEYMNVPGVRSVVRAGRYRAEANWSEGDNEGFFLGLDSSDFSDVAYFRGDFASAPLAELMKDLSLDERALLVSRQFLKDNSLKVGDRMLLTLNIGGETSEMEFIVAGALDFFPTLYPEDGPFFVGNLDYIFAEIGGMYPYNIWIATDDGMSGRRLQRELINLKLTARLDQDSRRLMAEEQRRPERQGFFGLLSVGFVSAALFTALGFLIYALVSFQRRSIELGVLRAIGLSVGQMATFLVGEQLSLIAIGTTVGTALGTAASSVFIPFFQVRSGPHAQTPSFIVQVAWSDIFQFYLILGAMVVGVIAIMIWLLIRMKIFQAVKLEEVV
jgi:putative ABC transport system permease protein